MTPSTLIGRPLERVLAYVPLRDAYQGVVDALMRNVSDADLTVAEQALKRRYNAFVKDFGEVSQRINRYSLKDDPSISRILALEHVEITKGEKGKPPLVTVTGLADIFGEEPQAGRPKRRLMAPPVEPTTAGSASDALVYSLSWQGRIDLDYMSTLTGKPVSELIALLEGEIFLDPATQSWVPKDEYLSGDVVTKFQQAQALAQTEGRYASYAAALEAVQPKLLTIDSFSDDPVDGRAVPFGATYVPVPLVQQFVNENGGNVTIRLLNTPNKVEWYVDGAGHHEFLAQGYDYAKWVAEALNGDIPKVYTYDSVAKRDVLDPVETERYRQSLKQLKEQWDTWWKSDANASEQLVTIYNAMFNREAERKFDGSKLITPNSNPRITLRPGQKDSIWRALQTGNTLLAESTGWGKAQPLDLIGAIERRVVSRSHHPY